MSSSPSPSPSSSSTTPSTSSPLPSAPPATKDPRLTPIIVALVIIGVVLLGLIAWLTIKVRRKERSRIGDGSGGDGDASGSGSGSKRGSTRGPYHGTSIWERTHPAAKITPFGAPNHAPRFDHKPGADMRIAYRRPDGAWHFTDSRTPFTPAGVSDLENTPSPSPMSSSSASLFFPRYNGSTASVHSPSALSPSTYGYGNGNASTSTLGLYPDNPMSAKEQEVRAMKLAAAEPPKDRRYDEDEEAWRTYEPLTPPPPAYRRHSRDES
ncbi:hypothetical protein CC1G_04626 [Coprinopsis cinerea okayama7|uniref:Uncharacterized protein n=1 Tax=Coprinopsis cinerea (strain Okayama-7 / 130 / ATCC MYA-4618 / FGSC 9003) TaxID=240176 RepID=A8N4W6_COPC7|nr:hypothetical protein CC1G_04626 [Coprinopsis cinerea okayama7\|eukprot:XP_001829937.2 hypothetical protein CC1G_04626 [Coprinopsis cinerea okayama7\